MATTATSSPPDPENLDGTWGGVLTDPGGRPITDDGGRLVYASPTDDGQPYVLDAQGTPAVEPVTATGTDSGPDTSGDVGATEVPSDQPPAPADEAAGA